MTKKNQNSPFTLKNSYKNSKKMNFHDFLKIMCRQQGFNKIYFITLKTFLDRFPIKQKIAPLIYKLISLIIYPITPENFFPSPFNHFIKFKSYSY